MSSLPHFAKFCLYMYALIYLHILNVYVYIVYYVDTLKEGLEEAAEEKKIRERKKKSKKAI